MADAHKTACLLLVKFCRPLWVLPVGGDYLKNPITGQRTNESPGLCRPADNTVPRRTTPGRWATESYRFAVGNAHATPKENVHGQEHEDRNIPVVREQLTKAGVRLGAMLNEDPAR